MNSQPTAQSNLLVVDDEPSQLLTLRDIFESEGFQVAACNSYGEALNLCQHRSFAAAIVDLKLHGQDGVQLFRQMRDVQPAMRVIIHTGYGSFDSAKVAVNLGAHAYVEKAADPAELILWVHRAVKDYLSEALSHTERKYGDLINDVKAIVWECQLPERRFNFVSQQAESILGFPAQSWIDDPEFWSGILFDEDRGRYDDFCESCMAVVGQQDVELRVVAADGRLVWLHVVTHLVRDAAGTPLMMRGAMFDVTDQKESEQQIREMETQLAHVSRLSTMGEMVAGIAHEINQPLAAIANYAVASKLAIAKSDSPLTAPVESWLQTICEQTEACGQIIRGLNSFVKRDTTGRQWVDLNRVVRDSVKLIRCNQSNQFAEIEFQTPESSHLVYGNEVQLRQVVVNLLQNACDATCQCTSPYVKVFVERDDARIRVTIGDNGPGVDFDKRSKLFDAFFTTKPTGMGMGLAISKSIVETHGGDLTFDSTDDGARFHIHLPAASV